ncbi:MAG TPA: outer membrane protein assembly factor BamD [Bryobacteraceae bacterium]|nr:outer membrane protein assembly factor BamD [Bryobacteraceae bacterium]
MQKRNPIYVLAASALAVMLLSGFGFPFKKKKYEAPISKDTLQPDKVLFDRAIKDIEHGNYESARLVLNTLINTYDTSEYLAKAKLAIADSWYREGGAHGLAQAEAEYKDFILFYPNMEEAAQSQYKVCEIHYKQMEKADRDSAQATRAEDECRQVLKAFPNATQYVKKAEQMLRNVQEVLADKEFRAGDFYHHKGAFPAAANRFAYLTSQYPLYSAADQALWEEADSYRKMGDRFEKEEGSALTRIVKDYPLSAHVDEAKARLEALKQPVPQANADAYAHQKYEYENRTKPGMFAKTMGIFEGKPDMHLAAKSGTPAMETIRPAVPVSVPAAAAGTPTGVSDVVGGVVADSTNLDKSPDARMASQNGAVVAEGVGAGEQPASVGSNGQSTAATTASAEPAKPAAPPPTNHPATAKQIKDYQKAQQKAQQKAAREAKKKGVTPADAAAATPTTGSGSTPAAATGTSAQPAATSSTPTPKQ